MTDLDTPSRELPDPSIDEFFTPGMTADELLTLLEAQNEWACLDYFNNLPLHILDPVYIIGDEPTFRKDFDESVAEAKLDWHEDKPFEENLMQEQKSGKAISHESYKILSKIYVSMRNKGYPKYTKELGKSSLT